MIEALLLTLAFPLRVMATLLATGILKLFGADASCELTTLRIGDAGLAITDSCSGIEQLGAMLIVGVVIARLQQRNWPLACYQYGFIIPSIVISNAIRLAITAALYLGPLGETALNNTWHVSLGWVQTALSFAIFLGFGKLVSTSCRKEEK